MAERGGPGGGRAGVALGTRHWPMCGSVLRCERYSLLHLSVWLRLSNLHVCVFFFEVAACAATHFESNEASLKTARAVVSGVVVSVLQLHL